MARRQGGCPRRTTPAGVLFSRIPELPGAHECHAAAVPRVPRETRRVRRRGSRRGAQQQRCSRRDASRQRRMRCGSPPGTPPSRTTERPAGAVSRPVAIGTRTTVNGPTEPHNPFSTCANVDQRVARSPTPPVSASHAPRRSPGRRPRTAPTSSRRCPGSPRGTDRRADAARRWPSACCH